MRKLRVLYALLFAALLVASCSKEPPVGPETQATGATALDIEALAAAVAARGDWELDAEHAPIAATDEIARRVIAVDREVLAGDIVHYGFDLQIGTGVWDKIRLHRVVREAQPHQPIRTKKNIFLLHGDGLGFIRFIFGAATPNLPDDYSVAAFLAENGVDVWGMDQNWVLVPAGLPDYSFAADWGMQNQVDNLGAGLAVARLARLMTGNGFGKMNLLGYSSGGITGYAYLNQETQRPKGLRNVGGFVVADVLYKYDRSVFETSRLNVCGFADYYKSLNDGGEYNVGFGELFNAVGYLAETAPGDPSPIIPTLTNLQVALFFGAVPEVDSFTPWYHYVSGVYENDFPVDLRYTTIGAWLDFIQEFVYFEPTAFAADYAAIACDNTDVPFDDHLGEIYVPVLLVGAAGGFGETGFHTLDLLGSTDKTIVNVSLYPPEVLDFGHIDLMISGESQTQAWTPILDWIVDHARGRGVGDEFRD